MGVSEGRDGGGIGVDYCVGTIVWVRRRNGSWWPGRILGPEELSASHLMSPRSGTPVKLLGREDASVDWYNLEKSKRVKAFRCGEFDACIEKAEVSLGVPIKKREKYARREDAILHALELERKQIELEQKHAIITDGTTSKPLGAVKREFSNMSSADTLARNDESALHYDHTIHKSPLPREAGLLQEEQNIIDSMNINDGKECEKTGGDKDTSEVIPRMRGLQDFGFRIPSKKKLAQSASWLTTRKPSEKNNALVRSGNIAVGTCRISNGKGYLTIKQKRSDGSILEEYLVKKRDRRRPLLQVLKTSAKLEAPHSYQLDQYPHVASMQEEKEHTVVTCRAKRSRCINLSADSVDLQGNTGYSSEETQTLEGHFGMDNCRTQHGSLAEDCSFSEMSETNESDSYTRDYLETEMEGDVSDDTGRSFAPKSKDCSITPFHISEEFGFMDNDEVPYSSNIPHPFEHTADASAEAGASNWHMKGKRNIRNIVKMPVDMMDGKICVTASDKYVGFERETADVARCSSVQVKEMEPPGLGAEGQSFYHIKEGYNASDEVDLIGEDLLPEQVNEYNSQRYKDLGRSHLVFNNFEGDSHLMLTSRWEADRLRHVARRKYWEGSDEFNDPGFVAHANREMASFLFDVNLKVKASYLGERVPLVSLMSRLNGKAIIGHPIQIEILEDGSSGQYFSGIHACPDENTVHQPVWRTARRTAMQRVPRSNLLASSFEDDEAEGSRSSELQNKYSLNLYSDHFKNQTRIAKHKVFHARQPLSSKFQKKSLKRISLSNQKTRTLSSFAAEKRHGGQNGNPAFARDRGILSGFIKQEEQVPSVTCVPVKVAFSRILEAVGRPSSTVSHHVRRMTNPATKDPL